MSQSWRAQYPFQSKWFDRGDGIRMHYVDEGAGEPVVMVHGNPSWSFYYRELIKALRPSMRAIAVDHVGMGLSDKPGDGAYDHTLKERVDDLERLLDSLKLGPVTLVVHDWGGAIGFAWASRDPRRVKRLVVLNTAAFLAPEGRDLPWQLALSRTWIGALLIRGLNLFSAGAVQGCVTRRPMTPEARAGYLAPYDSWAHRRAVLRFVQDIPRAPGDKAYALMRSLGEGLGRFAQVPMLIAWGARDFVFDDSFLDEWRRRFPAAEVRRLPDAGHYVLEDAPEELVPLISGFARGHAVAG